MKLEYVEKIILTSEEKESLQTLVNKLKIMCKSCENSNNKEALINCFCSVEEFLNYVE